MTNARPFRRLWLAALTMLCLPASTAATAKGADSEASQATVVELWPSAAPAWPGTTEPERDTSGPDGGKVADRAVIRLGHVAKPQLHVYPAAADATHASTMVIVCPGGGYSILAWDLEGTEIAEELNSLGFSAAIVKYRVPTRQMERAWMPPVQDIQRAVSLLRNGKIESGQVFDRIGVVGFSAGGNAAARVAAAAGKRFYEPVDQADEAGCQVDFAGLVYPWLMIKDEDPKGGDDESRLGIIPELQINSATPPMFLAHAMNDPISCRNSLELFSALQLHKVVAELHIFSGGGHGFGARDKAIAAANWPEHFAKWLRTLPANH